MAQAMTSRGYIAVLVDYRRYPAVRFPEIIDDARRAVEWVNGNIERYGGDSRSIFLMGHSAGAHLGAMLTLDESYLHPDTYKGIRGFIGLAGPYDFFTSYRTVSKSRVWSGRYIREFTANQFRGWGRSHPYSCSMATTIER